MLSLLAHIYGWIVDLRNRLYDKGVLDTFDLGARTISIGNITTGGTGKTPMAAYVAGVLADRGERVCILTRGYGRKNPKNRVLVSDGETVLVDAATGGDEPVELAQKLIGKHVVIIADTDRVAAAEWATRKFGVTVFVLDDGFQHRRAKRDVDIVCIDATDPFGGGKILPAGRLREPPAGLKRADAVIITRSDLVENISDLRSEISNIAPDGEIFTARTQLAKKLAPESAFAFCALGNADSFISLLRQNGAAIAGTRSFRDHHTYAQQDINDLEREALTAGAAILMTTAKDAVKLSKINFAMPCFVVEIEVELDRTDEFASML